MPETVNENVTVVSLEPVVKQPAMLTCTKCGKQFPGTGKRGRPFKLCPDCRAKK